MSAALPAPAATMGAVVPPAPAAFTSTDAVPFFVPDHDSITAEPGATAISTATSGEELSTWTWTTWGFDTVQRKFETGTTFPFAAYAVANTLVLAPTASETLGGAI